ncbi:MAG TPA: hypothetical protein VNJ05_08630, partial [Sphingomicrobium sp.]|nr:hypothetical protein [Sphingomicrobium sp.]
MSAHPQSSPLGDYGDPHPILIVASSEAALGRASRTVDAAGYRHLAMTVEEAPERLAIQPYATAIWVELDEDSGEPIDRLFDQVNAEASAGHYPAIVAAPTALIDPVVARIRHPEVDLLIDPSLSDRAAALATATAWAGYKRSGVNEDVSRESREPSAARLRQLSDEVSRIAATLARLSVGPGTSVEKPEP